MGVRVSARPVPDTYLRLVKRFPLIHIRDEHHLNEALEMLNKLFRQERDTGAQEDDVS
jgi:hypothetical protein